MGLLLLQGAAASNPVSSDNAEFAYHLVFFGEIRFEAITFNVNQIIAEVL